MPAEANVVPIGPDDAVHIHVIDSGMSIPGLDIDTTAAARSL